MKLKLGCQELYFGSISPSLNLQWTIKCKSEFYKLIKWLKMPFNYQHILLYNNTPKQILYQK